MSRAFYGRLASLVRAPADAAEKRARIAARVAAFEAERARLDAPCKLPPGFKAAVVGAGLAGLQAALALARQGMQVRLFEARAEVGGRVQTDTTSFPGRVIETGAELIGAIHPMCLSLAKRHGIALVTRTDDEAAGQMLLESRMLIGAKFMPQRELIKQLGQLRDKVLLPIAQRARLVLDPAAPWKQKSLLERYDRVDVATIVQGLGVAPGSELWQLLELLLVNDNVAPLDELNYLGLLCLVRAGHGGGRDRDLMGYWEDLENFRCADGCASFARILRDEFVGAPQGVLTLNAEVTSIDLTGRPRVGWRRVDSQAWPVAGSNAADDFDFVVLATPPSVWYRTKITLKDRDFARSVGIMKTGPAIKYFSGFDDRFWVRKGWAALGGAKGLGQVWEGTDNQCRLPGQQVVLSVFAGGVVPDEAAIRRGLETLYPGYAGQHPKTLSANWPKTPFVETGYASPALEQVLTVGKALNEPLDQRLCFAGEHTSMAYFGYMEGALRSGARAADQILRLACRSKPAAPPERVRTAETSEPEAEDEVIGDDERRRVTDTLVVPNRWVCAIDLRVDDPLQGKGAPPITLGSRATGILIGPRHVLTAAHVFNAATIPVQSREREVPITSVRVSPARNGDNESHPFGFAISHRWHRSQEGRPLDDYALIVLDEDVSQRSAKGSKAPLGYWGEDPKRAPLRRLDPAPLGQPLVSVVGYAGDRCGNDVIAGEGSAKLKSIEHCVQHRRDEWASTQWRAAGRAQMNEKLSLIVHGADTYKGQSGAPICLRNGDVFDLLGVHGGEVTPADGGPVLHNRGVRVTRRMLRELCRWINAEAGRTWAHIVDDALVFDAAPPASEDESVFESDSPPSPSETQAIRAAARKIDDGLQAAAAMLAGAPAGSTRQLVGFVVSLLQTHFFPRGYGSVGADGRVLKTSARARIEMAVDKDDGSRWPFEHRLRLWLAARDPERAAVGGTHDGAFFSSITLYAPRFESISAAQAAGVAAHETVHLLFRLIDRLRERHGDDSVQRFLARDPWRLLDERPFDAHRRQIGAGVAALRKLLPMMVDADALARSLLREAFAYTLQHWIVSAIDAVAEARRRGPKIAWQSIGIAPVLVRHYVLESAPGFAASLAAPEVQRAIAALAPALEAAADALRAHWGEAFRLGAPAREALVA